MSSSDLASGSLGQRIIGFVFYVIFFGTIVWVSVDFVSTFVHTRALTPDTPTPEAVWVPVVNPEKAPIGDPVAGVYRVDFRDGTSCFVYRGILSDEFSCVRPGLQ